METPQYSPGITEISAIPQTEAELATEPAPVVRPPATRMATVYPDTAKTPRRARRRSQ
jgi:hypothetical protein